jgi:hypothetical protein
MRVICAWCKVEMGDKEPFGDTTTSHGICPKCLLENHPDCHNYGKKGDIQHGRKNEEVGQKPADDQLEGGLPVPEPVRQPPVDGGCGLDFYIENGKYIWTEHFLRERGFCCECGCRHCPWGFKKQKPVPYIKHNEKSLPESPGAA